VGSLTALLASTITFESFGHALGATSEVGRPRAVAREAAQSCLVSAAARCLLVGTRKPCRATIARRQVAQEHSGMVRPVSPHLSIIGGW
jgi:hypothetical protein